MTTRASFTPLSPTDFAAAFPNSRKVYVDGPSGVRVPMREIALSNGESLRVYDFDALKAFEEAELRDAPRRLP